MIIVVLFSCVISLSVFTDPQEDSGHEQPKVRVSKLVRLKEMIKELLKFEIILVMFTSGIRNAGGYVLAYNVNEYFETRDVNVASYMSWVPLVGGMTGAAVGGLASDRLSKKYGLQGRLMLLVGSQVSTISHLDTSIHPSQG